MVSTPVRASFTQTENLNSLLLLYLINSTTSSIWGDQNRPVDQLTIALTLHEMANHINDPHLRREIQGATGRAVCSLSEEVTRT